MDCNVNDVLGQINLKEESEREDAKSLLESGGIKQTFLSLPPFLSGTV